MSFSRGGNKDEKKKNGMVDGHRQAEAKVRLGVLGGEGTCAEFGKSDGGLMR